MKRYALHKIYDTDAIGFNPKDYSKFKFGDKEISRDFGYALAEGFIREYLIDNPIKNQIVVCSSPYCFIPTATFAMKDYFVQKLNQYLVASSLPVVQETKIHRTITYKEDYGALSADERMALIKNDGFHIDKSFLEDKTILFMDDIKITGSHERVVQRMVDEFALTNKVVFLYFAELLNPDIHPKFENDLNYAYVKSLLHLDKIIKNEEFILNTRIVKYILNSDHEEFKAFIHYQKLKLVSTIYNSALGNSYHKIDEYKNNLDYLREYINKTD